MAIRVTLWDAADSKTLIANTDMDHIPVVGDVVHVRNKEEAFDVEITRRRFFVDNVDSPPKHHSLPEVHLVGKILR